jgi:hypothetical protein
LVAGFVPAISLAFAPDACRFTPGDFYERRSFLSPLRRLQFAYGFLLFASKLGFRLRHGGIRWRPQ